MNYGIREYPEAKSKGRKRFISQFYEDNHAAHYSPDYQDKLNNYPNLFSKQKSEFTKFTNAMPSSKLVIRSTSYAFMK